jgi:carboxypeptidase Q
MMFNLNADAANQIFKKQIAPLLLIGALLISFVNPLPAQQETVDTAAFRQIREAEMNSSQVAQIAHYITDVSGSRLTNSPGFMRAGNWAIETMKSWGLQNAGFEAWGEYGRGWDIEDFHISMKAPYSGYILGYALPWSSNTDGEIRADVFLINYANLLDSAFLEKHAADFKGKIILINSLSSKRDDDSKPFSTRYTDSELVKIKDMDMITRLQIEGYLKFMKPVERGKLFLKSAGALAMVSINGSNRDGTVTVQNSGGYKTNSPVKLPEAIISSEDGSKLKRLIASGHRVELALFIKGKFYSDDTRGYNVVAEIPGTDPRLKDQIVMLGGHLDSWNAATGATDNGAGCIVMLEAVRLLDSLHLKPKRTIRIALWSGEEQGILGSYHYVKNHFGDAETGDIKKEQGKISGYFNLDNGSGKIRGIFAQGDTAIVPVFEQWLASLQGLGANTVTLHNTGSTDHLSFDWIGIPAFQFIQDPLDYETKTHHSNMDVYDYLKLDDLKQSAIVVASFVYQTSIRPDLLPRKKIVKEKFAFDGF